MVESSRTEEGPRTYHNIVIALAGPYGAGCSSLREEMTRLISDWPGCHVEEIKVSKLIEFYHKALGMQPALPRPSELRSPERRKILQDAGTQLRKRRETLVGEAVVIEVNRRGKKMEALGADLKHDATTLVFLVDSLKNPCDLEVLRTTYRDKFILVYVHANEDTRWRRMRDYYGWKETEKKRFQECDDVDWDEAQVEPKARSYGQKVQALVSCADYYILNQGHRNELREQGKRLFSLFMGCGHYQPTRDERSMHLAFSAAAGSYCLSRQVGAAIVDDGGNVLGVGHNDVPKYGGGLYSGEDATDRRCYLVGDRGCINQKNKDERFKRLASMIVRRASKSIKYEVALDVISKSELQQATEYCRAVHAEMEAILSVSRNAHGTTVGASLYVTAQPCHNCTKHIVCAGIDRVVYIEPYPKSLGDELHSDSIAFDRGGGSSGEKVLFSCYQGVAPTRFHQVFTTPKGLKNAEGRMSTVAKEDAAGAPRVSSNTPKTTRAEAATPGGKVKREMIDKLDYRETMVVDRMNEFLTEARVTKKRRRRRQAGKSRER